MSNYIMSVDSFVNTFSVIDTSQTICFSMKMQKRDKDFWESDFAALWEGDRILIFRRKPLSTISVVLEVLESSGKEIKFQKKLEVANGYELTDESARAGGMEGDLENDVLIEVTDAFYEKICRELVDGFMRDGLNIDGDADEESRETLVQGARTSQEAVSQGAQSGETLAQDGQMQWDGVPRVTGGANVLLYGVPGAGKSHEIQEKYCDDPSKIERVVFHPDYTYSDFVGQIMPRVEEGRLKYIFTPGPFTRMLKKAWDHPAEKYYLVVEEINRGNAPAIFGEVFQLLDRKKADDPRYEESECGESEYGISNYDVAADVYGDAAREVRIPSNMWVLATMNTADQNVFTLDTAFQRRWDMHHIKNDVHAAGHAQEKIEGSEITWGNFASVINELVVEFNADLGGFEDKRLGAYFVRGDELSKDKFPEKVLKYLWEDAFKMEREAVFDEKFKSLDQVIEAFCAAEEDWEDPLDAVLRPEVYRKMGE